MSQKSYVLKTAMCRDGKNLRPGTVVTLDDEEGQLALQQGTATLAPPPETVAAAPEAPNATPDADKASKPAKK